MKSFHLVDAAGLALITFCVAATVAIAVLIAETIGWPSSLATLIPGVGVAAGIWTVVWQQGQITRRESDTRRAKNLAARAIMPPALSEILSYAAESARRIRLIYGPDEQVEILDKPSLTPPTIPYDALKVLKECVEFADDRDARSIAKCVRMIQIQNARLAGFLDQYARSAVSPYDCLSILADTVELHAYCGSLFKYGRLTEDSISPDAWKSGLLASGWDCGVVEGSYDAVLTALQSL